MPGKIARLYSLYYKREKPCSHIVVYIYTVPASYIRSILYCKDFKKDQSVIIPLSWRSAVII